MKNTFMVIDLRPDKIIEKTTGLAQEGIHSLRRKAVRGEITEACVAAALATAIATLTPDPAFAYEQGTIMRKAQPLIDILKDAAEPLGYGMYIWAAIRYIQGQRGEAKEIAKGVTWGLIAIYMLPMFFDIIKGIGDVPATPTNINIQ